MNCSLSNHAVERAQVRGCTKQAANLILTLYDRTNFVADGVRAIWLSKKRAELLRVAGMPVSVIDRIRRYIILVDAETGRVVTILNGGRPGAKRYRRNFRRKRDKIRFNH